MKKSFLKNLLRDIRKTLSRFLSIVIIIAIGVAFYAGVRATSPDMKMSLDYYFTKNNFMDYKLISTLGLTKDDVTAIEKQKGIKTVEGAYSIDAVIEKEKRALVLNINSLPSENGINKIRMVKGKKAQNDKEAVVEQTFLEQNKLKLGDKIVLKSGNDTRIKDKLKNNEFTIVGTAISPLYISVQRQLSSLGNGSVKGFVYVLPRVFKSEVFTEIYVKAYNNESKNSLLNNEEYNNYNEIIEKALKTLGTVRNKIRYSEIYNKASELINKGEVKLNNSKKEVFKKFSDAYKKINIAKDKLADGKRELEKNERLFKDKISTGKKQIDEGKSKIKSGEETINKKGFELQNGKLKLIEGEKQLFESEEKLKLGKQETVYKISSEINKSLSDLKKQLELDPNNQINLQQYNTLLLVNDKYIKGKDFDSMYTLIKQDNMLENVKVYFDLESIKNNFDKASKEITLGKQELLNKENQLKAGETKIIAGRNEIEINKKKIETSDFELKKEEIEGRTKLDNVIKEIEAGEKEILKNIQKLKSEEKKAKDKLIDGETEILKSKNKLNDIKDPIWYVLGRAANVGYESYRQDSDRIDNIGKAFPLIFFLVAALVSLTTMTRMVQEKRIEIGTFKALGYSSFSIVTHYLVYSLSASVIGSLIGVFIGFRLFPPLIINAYSSLYTIPDKVAPFNLMLALQSGIIAILFTVVAAIAATLEELREVPASLMRPKAPKSGKKILLEKFKFLWKRLNFTEKVTARNIFRYKQRLIMTVIGIAACTGLMITGFGLKAGIIGATETQFSKIYKYDMNGNLFKNISEEQKNDIKEKVFKDSNIKSIIFTYSKNSLIKKNDKKSEDAYLVVPEDKESFNNFIELISKGEALKLDESGIIITQKLSKLINKNVGDSVVITLNNKDIKAKISGITEHYIQHYIYMSPIYYKRITGNNVIFNSFYGNLKDISEDHEIATANKLRNIKEINSVGFKNNLHLDFQKSMDSVNSVVLILIICAGILAFVVIYNLTNININERRRELATIKLLGFYNNELAAYIYRENIILTIIGSFTGILFGVVMNKLIVTTAETNVIMFLKTINPIYFLYSILLTLVFAIIVNLVMYSRFDKIDMIESLKSAE